MTASGSAPPIRAAALLERAVSYTRGGLAHVRPEDLTRPTPCERWSLAQLLMHMDDALAAMTEAVSEGTVALHRLPPDIALEALLDSIRSRACSLLGSWSLPADADPVALGPRRLARETLGCVGGLEITLHGWDVSQATGLCQPIPEALAAELLPVAREFITDADRPRRFGAPVEVPIGAGAADLLLAHAGRRP
jgi:uncharacterized protein (TIGR03086 family)